MKYLGRIIVVGVILAIFGGVFLFVTSVEQKADDAERALAVQRVAREVFSVHLCKGGFLSSCRGIAQDVCSKEVRELLEKCTATQFAERTAGQVDEQGSAILTCALTKYLEVHPDRIKRDGECNAPTEVDQKALNDEIFAAIEKL